MIDHVFMICRERSRIAPAARFRLAAPAASMAARYRIVTSLTGSAFRISLSKYWLWAFSARRVCRYGLSDFLEVLGEPQNIIGRNLRYHFAGFAFDNTHNRAPCFAIEYEGKLVVLPEELRGIHGSHGLNKAALILARRLRGCADLR